MPKNAPPMGALLPRRMSTEPAPSSPESSDSRKRRSLLALSSVTRKPAAAANAALREEVQQALAAEPALLEPLLAALPAEALQLALAAVRRRRPAAAESEGDAATAIQSVYRGHASRRRESLASEAHRCLVFGSLNMDLHAVTGQKWPRAGHIVTLTHGHFVANPGGKGANEAVALARLGSTSASSAASATTRWASSLAALQDDVGTGGITKAPNSTTAITVLMQAKTHQVKLTCVGANDEIDGRELGEALRHLPPPPPAAPPPPPSRRRCRCRRSACRRASGRGARA